jgi:hypothetical protein
LGVVLIEVNSMGASDLALRPARSGVGSWRSIWVWSWFPGIDPIFVLRLGWILGVILSRGTERNQSISGTDSFLEKPNLCVVAKMVLSSFLGLPSGYTHFLEELEHLSTADLCLEHNLQVNLLGFAFKFQIKPKIPIKY